LHLIFRKKIEIEIKIKYIRMNMRTYEMYDENEYFIKFQRISPTLLYMTDTYSLKKIIYQKNLLNNLNENKITLEEFKNQYQIIINNEIKQKITLENLKKKLNNIVDIMKINQYNDLVKHIDQLI
jgi:hypothetical protein